ncbi:MAG: response regulator transcription factor [Epsilonproteobacteria bacterium]|nr:response regulator transcription factor [Sulfurospirillum cavolei]MDY0263558.1 response regulator transcription factor [Sulfurospirillum cavolei]NCB54103.1 response regulator transcription factor [Campylobacterota bacterium]
MKLLLLEDDYNYNESIKEYLEFLGYEVDAFFDGESALDAIMQKTYYLFLLDVKVPKLNGHELIKYIKEAKITTPIIIITSLVDIDNIAIGYELGCNDYLKKPFELKELELRVKELIKKHYQTGNEGLFELACGLRFNFETGEIKKDDQTIILSSKEQELVRFLIRRKNTFCDIETLRENVWEGKEISYADIRMYIRKIRLKVGVEAFIKSSRGLGYKIDVDA